MGSIYKRGHVYWIKYYRSGQSFRESSKSDRKSDAVRLLHLREGHLAEGRPFSPRALRLRFEDLAADVRNDYASRGLRTTRRVNELLAHLSRTFAGWQASEITTDAIRAYIASRQQEGAANGTINRETAALGRGFTLALQAGKLWHKSHIPKLRETLGKSSLDAIEQRRCLFSDVPFVESDDQRPSLLNDLIRNP